MILIPFVTIILAAGAIFFGMRGCGGHTTDEESYGTLDVDTVAADTVPNLEEVTNVDIQLDDGYKTKFKYTGTVDADGKATGKGIGIYENGTYEGEYTKNLRDGEGTFRLHDGSNTFKGKFRRDYYDSGRLTLSDGTYYTGSFNDGQPYNGVWYKKDGSLISYVKNGE